jgi:hypothetical protein
MLASWITSALLALFLLCSASVAGALQQAPAPCSAQEQQQAPLPPEPRRVKIASLKFKSEKPLPPIADRLSKTVLKQERDIEEGEGWDTQVTGAIMRTWENEGYARIQVDDLDQQTLSESDQELTVALTATIDPGRQYRTAAIRFSPGTSSEVNEKLLSLIPLRAGDLYVEDKVRDAIDQIRLTFEQNGYIRFAGVPVADYDDANGTASVTIDWNPGKQFRVGKVEILGLEPGATQHLIEKYGWAPGSVYNGLAFTGFLESDDINLVTDSSQRARIDPSFDEDSGIANLKIDFRPCP